MNNKKRTLEKIQKKYPNVNNAAGYIPGWVFFFEGHPILSRAVISVAGLMSGALLTLLILLIL